MSTDEGDLQHLDIPQIPPTPARRPSQQTKLLRMMEQASEATDVIEGLDLDGIIAFTRYLDRMKASAQTNLERRAIAEKALRRRRM
jgi:ERCC4-related helicase